MNYKPGLHILATFHAPDAALTNMQACQAFFNRLIADLQLQQVGAVYHTFENGSFTATIGLTESHLSIHTWPEHGLATFDVFLSNFRNDNSAKARTLYERTLAFFEATASHHQEIFR